jgi:hypothetical protein
MLISTVYLLRELFDFLPYAELHYIIKHVKHV